MLMDSDRAVFLVGFRLDINNHDSLLYWLRLIKSRCCELPQSQKPVVLLVGVNAEKVKGLAGAAKSALHAVSLMCVCDMTESL